MKKWILILFFFTFLQLYSQGEANFWYFGQNAGIDFNSGTPVPITGQLSTNEGCSSFSDKTGKLLFYSDGITVWDKNGNIMPNGRNLFGDPSSSQSAIIVPHPGNENLYYLFTVGANDYDRDGNITTPTKGMYCYTVDMTRNLGLGDIVGSGIDLSNGSNSGWTEKITSVKGKDCNSFWVISLVRNTFITYKIDLSGLNTSPIISPVNFKATDPRGYLKVSPNGKYLASATYNLDDGNLILYTFNDATGVVNNDGIELITNIAVDGSPYGVEFSPLSSKLYSSTFNDSHNTVFQFDLSSSNILASKTIVHSKIGFRGALQLAPNGKIYATVPIDYNTGTPFLDAINNPEIKGLACNYQNFVVFLGNNSLSMQGLPPFISSILLPIEISDGLTGENLNKTISRRCIGENYTLKSQNIEGTVTYKWIYNGQVISTTPSITINNLDNSKAGTYYLEAETIDKCDFKISYKGEVTIEVYPYPTITKPSNIIQCDDDGTMDGFVTLNLSNLRDSEVLNGQSPTNFEVLYFNFLTDAINNTNALPKLYKNRFSFTSETIYVRIHNKLSPTCYKIESFDLQIFEYPNPPKNITALKLCDSNTTGTDIDGFETFDLTQKETEILNGSSVNKFSVNYYLDAALTNQIPNPKSFPNTTKSSQTIYIQIFNKQKPECKLTTSFTIEVLELPFILPTFTLKQCDNDAIIDGFSNFNLTAANSFISKGNKTYKITYYLNLGNAINKTSVINPVQFSNKTQPKVFARIENEAGCFRISEIELLVSSTSFPGNYIKKVVQCDDDDTNDGKNLFNLSALSSDFISLFPLGQNLEVTYFRNLSDAQLEENEISTNQLFLNEIAFKQTLYVRVESKDNGECFGLGNYLELIVNERPKFELNTTAIYCKNLPPIIQEIYNPQGDYTYEWTDENGAKISNLPYATISKKGIYTVIATSKVGCTSFPEYIDIKESEIATISYNDITVVDDSDDNSITFSTSNLGVGDYEFTLNSNGFYQDKPLFEHVDAGIHTLFIRDKNNCGVATIEVPVIGYPRFFTPNNDGYNDTWKVLGVSGKFYVNSNIYIFDRYGKLITKIDPKNEGWNGTFKGSQLPATDYWFSVELIDNSGNIKIRKGHFSLKR